MCALESYNPAGKIKDPVSFLIACFLGRSMRLGRPLLMDSSILHQWYLEKTCPIRACHAHGMGLTVLTVWQACARARP